MDYPSGMVYGRHHGAQWPVRVLALGLLLAAAPLAATTVYKTVDERGRVSFSDQPPPAGAPVEVLDYSVPDVRPSELVSARLEAMRETTDRMAADRREREAHRAKLRAEARAAEAAANPAPAYQDYYPPYRTIVRRGGILRPGWGHPPLRPRPPIAHPPGFRPPLRPGLPGSPEVTRDVVSLYNEYPATLIRKRYKGGARREFYGR
jgi:hypothetical protein